MVVLNVSDAIKLEIGDNDDNDCRASQRKEKREGETEQKSTRERMRARAARRLQRVLLVAWRVIKL